MRPNGCAWRHHIVIHVSPVRREYARSQRPPEAHRPLASVHSFYRPRCCTRHSLSAHECRLLVQASAYAIIPDIEGAGRVHEEAGEPTASSPQGRTRLTFAEPHIEVHPHGRLIGWVVDRVRPPQLARNSDRGRQSRRMTVDCELTTLVYNQEHLLAVVVEMSADRALSCKRPIVHEVQACNRVAVEECLNAKGTCSPMNGFTLPGFGPVTMAYALGERIASHQ